MKSIKKTRTALKITDKKLQDGRLLYLLVRDDQPSWIEFQHLGQYLELVMDYEKSQQREPQPQPRPGSEPYQNKISSLREKARMGAVTNLVFLNRSEGELFFRVYYEGGATEVMSSGVLRLRHPQQLIDFYESNVRIQQPGL